MLISVMLTWLTSKVTWEDRKIQLYQAKGTIEITVSLHAEPITAVIAMVSTLNYTVLWAGIPFGVVCT